MPILFLCLVLGGWATLAWGHVDIEPRQSIAKRWETYTVRVPTETPTATVKVHMVVPPAFEIEMVEHSEIWRVETVRDASGFVRELTWSESRVPPQTFAEMKFMARNPAEPGLYGWEFTQFYEGGDSAPWTSKVQIVAQEGAASQRAQEAWRAAQVALTVSLVAIGVALTLILVTLLGIVRSSRPTVSVGDEE